jgi:outer membrane receptor protein involved in Fe transport
MTNPIEFFESAGSDTVIARRLENAVSGETTGVEVEFLKELSFLGDWGDMFFVQGNFTIQDTELDASNIGDATNPVRPLAGASEYMVNFMLGFDSPDTKHTASLSFNTFGERLYSAGRNGSPDAYEQPFDSLDATYFWYPTDRLTAKLKLSNLLGESVRVTQGGVATFEEDPGTSYSVSVSWSF